MTYDYECPVCGSTEPLTMTIAQYSELLERAEAQGIPAAKCTVTPTCDGMRRKYSPPAISIK